MALHRHLRDIEGHCNEFVGLTLGQEMKDIHFTRSQLCGRLPTGEFGRYRRRDKIFPPVDIPDTLKEILTTHILEQIAARSGTDRTSEWT